MTLLVDLPGHSLRARWDTWSLQPKPLVHEGCSFQSLPNLQDWDGSKLHGWHLSPAGPLAPEEAWHQETGLHSGHVQDLWVPIPPSPLVSYVTLGKLR